MFNQFSNRPVQRCLPVAAGLIALIITACSTTVSQEFRRTENSVVEASFVATDADFGKYRRLTAADMGIFFPQNSAIPDADTQRIRSIFRQSFLDELSAYEIVDKPGRDVMMVEASLIDLRLAAFADVPNLRPEIRSVARPGSLVFLMEMKDSETGRVLARAADSTLNPNIGSDDLSESEWDEVELAAAHWATLFRRFLDQNLNK
jgi:hypothetical protein